jgi:uncharacterized protein YjbI with pentapeptide repeats
MLALSGGTRAVANDEHLALLQQGSSIWNNWRKRDPGCTPDLSGANLRGANLRGANLQRADLRDAKLNRTDLSGANLDEADLRRTDLVGANLSKADLGFADLDAADLSGASLNKANLYQAKITGANLSGANLNDANLSEADLSWAKLAGADLSGAYFFETNLRSLDLTNTIGLDYCQHVGPSSIDFRTLFRFSNLPISFLRGCGLPDTLIEYLSSLHGQAIQFYSCFISYSTKDQLFAQRLYADLQNKGVRCWFAPDALRIGAKIWDAIDEEIRVRDKLLVILSEASIASGWVEDEVTSAYEEEGERKTTLLFPIRIDDAVTNTIKPWARKLRARHIGDFRRWNEPAEYQKSLERLLRDLKAPSAAK